MCIVSPKVVQDLYKQELQCTGFVFTIEDFKVHYNICNNSESNLSLQIASPNQPLNGGNQDQSINNSITQSNMHDMKLIEEVPMFKAEKQLQCKNIDYKPMKRQEYERHCKITVQCTGCPSCFYKPCKPFGQTMNAMASEVFNFICYKCQETFDQKENLNVHILKAHEGLSPFSCTNCHFETTSKPGLKKHMEICSLHIIQNNFKGTSKDLQCHYCDYKDKNQENLDLHMKFGVSKMANCSFCSFKSCTPIGLIKHNKEVHGQEKGLKNKHLQCENCDYKTDRRDYLEKHSEVKTKPVQCNFCPYKCCSVVGLGFHRKEVHGQQKVVTNKVKKHL